jgi:hypothetical protein
LIAPYVPPTPSTSSIYVLPATPTSTYVALVVDSVTSPAYVAPTTTKAPTATTTALAQAIASLSGSSSSSTCSYESPYIGDLTYYTAGLSACGLTTNSDKEMVIALLHDFMGTQSNGNPYCSKTVIITYEGTSITITVVDKCIGCIGYSIDLSNLAFSSLRINFA